MTRKHAIWGLLILLFVLTCGCTIPSSDGTQPISSETVVQDKGDFLFQDISGKSVFPSSEDIKGYLLSYTQGWVLNREGYTRIEKNATYGNITINEASSLYNVIHQGEPPKKIICNQSSYSASCDSEISGILQVDENAILFFPYENSNMSFFLLHPVENAKRKTYFDWSIAYQANGDFLKIQPIGIQFLPNDEETILNLLKTINTSSSQWYDVNLRFSSVSVSGYCYSEQEEIFSTRAFGYLDSENAISINNEVFLAESLGVHFMPWIFRGDL